MSPADKVTRYIEQHSEWMVLLTEIREVLKSTSLVEEIKWGAPAYTYNKKILVGLGAFKNHMGIWFHQGVLLKDTHKKLMNAQEGKTKALRQWRFDKGDVVDKKILVAYVNEAIENCIAGKEIKVKQKTKIIVLDPILKKAMVEDKSFKKSFSSLTLGKQREYAEYIAFAKREATRLRRLKKIIPMVLAKQGLNDKYKNS